MQTKKISAKAIVFALVVVIWVSRPAQSQITQHHFFTHGWLSTKTSMEPMADDMATRYIWTEPSILPDYASLMILGWGIATLDQSNLGVYPQLYSAHTSNYVGLGWSLGGNIARYEAKHDGTNFIQGLVTTHSPNLGTEMGDFGHRALFIPRWVDAEDRLSRGDAGFIYDLAMFPGGDIIEVMIDAIAEILHAFITYFLGGVANDIAPGSGFLNDINGTQPSGVKRVALWGTANYPYFPSYTSDADCQSWIKQQAGARKNANDDNNIANSIHPHWYCPWKYISQAWYRSRSADWNTTANAMDDLENAWEDCTSGRGEPSDGFIGEDSQQGIPSPDAVLSDNYNDPTTGNWVPVNHGNAVYDHSSNHFDKVKAALNAAGAH